MAAARVQLREVSAKATLGLPTTLDGLSTTVVYGPPPPPPPAASAASAAKATGGSESDSDPGRDQPAGHTAWPSTRITVLTYPCA